MKMKRTINKTYHYFTKNKKKFIIGAIIIAVIAIILKQVQKKTTPDPLHNGYFNEWVGITKQYNWNDLKKWTPMPAPVSKPNEPGDMGEGVKVPSDLENDAEDRFAENQFNIVANELMSLNRSLQDTRSQGCLTKEYPPRLPEVSVIIVFHREAWSTLIRTIWSVITQSPREILKEIILVDDFSEMEHLGEQLEEYIKDLPVSVILARLHERKGLIVARLLGVEQATGKMLVFLDAHCECNQGWLEALISPIVEDRSIVTVPIINVIGFNDMKLASAITTNWGVFDMSMSFTWEEMPARAYQTYGDSKVDLFPSPAMAGGLFAIDAEYFHQLGEYDEDMLIWGGENIEMSLRIWMCGGQILTAPCSRVGHIFREKTPYKMPGGSDYNIYRNAARVVDVWLDEFKEIFYAFTPKARKLRTDVRKRLEIREKLKCKSFKWYLENIFPESSFNSKWIDVVSIENIGAGKCIDTMGRRTINSHVNLSSCHGLGGNQGMLITELNEIRPRKLCLDAVSNGTPVTIFTCHEMRGNQEWLYDDKAKTIIHGSTKLCMTALANDGLTISKCDGSSVQKWRITSQMEKDDATE